MLKEAVSVGKGFVCVKSNVDACHAGVQGRNDAERHARSLPCGFERLVSEPSSRAIVGRKHEILATCEHKTWAQQHPPPIPQPSFPLLPSLGPYHSPELVGFGTRFQWNGRFRV